MRPPLSPAPSGPPPRPRRRAPLLALGACAVGAAAVGPGCDRVRAVVVDVYPNGWAAEAGATPGGGPTPGAFDGPDAARPRLPVALEPVLRGLQQPTDLQFPPGRSDLGVVLQKGGQALLFDMRSGQRLSTLLDLPVLTRSEQGLLGLAFHPRFGPDGGWVFTNSTEPADEGDVTRISRWTVSIAAGAWTAADPVELLRVVQPYANHNAGQLAFGPDGMLYIGFGDGGWRGDPLDEGQSASSHLGSMLRIDVDHPEGDRPWSAPADNPGRSAPGWPAETFAIGLRNPWRYSFSPDGRLIVADVGQDLWEEIDLVPPGSNLGWSRREGAHCYPADAACTDEGLTDPIYEYPHGADGSSVTGGLVYTGARIPALHGRYVFGDFLSGRVWALELPAAPGAPAAGPAALGRWQVLISSFARDADGELYLLDFQGGAVHRIVPAPGPPAG